MPGESSVNDGEFTCSDEVCDLCKQCLRCFRGRFCDNRAGGHLYQGVEVPRDPPARRDSGDTKSDPATPRQLRDAANRPWEGE